jgi:hypothetical protein
MRVGFLREEQTGETWKRAKSFSLFDFQLDAQNSYLFTYNTFIKILYMFRALFCSSSGDLRRNYIYRVNTKTLLDIK